MALRDRNSQHIFGRHISNPSLWYMRRGDKMSLSIILFALLWPGGLLLRLNI